MRGKVERLSAYDLYRRITPAHAGKSRKPPRNERAEQDHPRPCGEKCLWENGKRQPSGSPPPMRGKANRSLSSPIKNGITPAHAGKRLHNATHMTTVWDHPRPCGEKSQFVKTDDFDKGSPPPMRGKVHFHFFALHLIRITPAHAGKSSHRLKPSAACRDHPRPCGEKLCAFT